MKQICVIFGLILIFIPRKSDAQSIVQVTEQLALDYQKLSELKSILTDMQKAYTIISTGYNNIKSISQGTFSLHKAFLDGLLSVSPAVQKYEKVIEIIDGQEEIVTEYKAALGRFNSAGVFNSQELNYISQVYSNLFSESLKNLEELTMVLTAGQLRMSDNERLSSIDRINRDVQDKLSFLRQFNDNTSVQAQQRLREQNDIGTVQSFYGISH